jgi:hypothetical protein
MFMTRGSLLERNPYRNAVRVGLDCSRGMERAVQVLAAHYGLKQIPDIQGCTASCTPLQHLWGSKTHTGTHTHIHSHACACAHTYKYRRAREYTGAHTHTYVHAQTDTRTHSLALTHRHTRAHVYARTRCARDGLCQFFSVASDAPTLVTMNMMYAM